jgi:Protein of unknown function (DUF2569)
LFCARCGQQIPAASETCPLCGQETTLKLEPAPSVPDVPYPFVTIPQTIQLSGVGGWLLLYCIGMAILVPLLISIQLFSWAYFLHASVRLVNKTLILAMVQELYSAIVGVFLWMGRPVALLLLRIHFIIVGVSTLVSLLALVQLALNAHTKTSVVRGFVTEIVSTGFTVLWFFYFRKSQRVRNTYGANL